MTKFGSQQIWLDTHKKESLITGACSRIWHAQQVLNNFSWNMFAEVSDVIYSDELYIEWWVMFMFFSMSKIRAYEAKNQRVYHNNVIHLIKHERMSRGTRHSTCSCCILAAYSRQKDEEETNIPKRFCRQNAILLSPAPTHIHTREGTGLSGWCCEQASTPRRTPAKKCETAFSVSTENLLLIKNSAEEQSVG